MEYGESFVQTSTPCIGVSEPACTTVPVIDALPADRAEAVGAQTTSAAASSAPADHAAYLPLTLKPDPGSSLDELPGTV